MDGEHEQEPVEVDLGDFLLAEPPVEEGPARRVEKTRALLAYLLLALLAVVMGSLLALLALAKVTVDEFGTIAGVLIAPLVGLVGAATGYYYGKGER